MATFIAIEGSDGSGKSTILTLLKEFFHTHKMDCVFTREPGGTKLGEEIRQLILNRKMSPLTELFLYEAARAEHVNEVIKPALKAGTHVICDRYTHSSLAYQGGGRGIPMDLIHKLNTVATDGLEPDLVLWLKLPPEIAIKRVKERAGQKNRFDLEKQKFHEAVYEVFLKTATADPRFIALDARQSPQKILEELLTQPRWIKIFGKQK